MTEQILEYALGHGPWALGAFVAGLAYWRCNAALLAEKDARRQDAVETRVAINENTAAMHTVTELVRVLVASQKRGE